MAEAKTPLAVIHDEFERARGEDLDGVWAYAVSWRLLRRDVEPDQVCEGLKEALALVKETQESPDVLFGEPAEHADALYDRWVEEGRLHLWDAARATWPEVPSSGLAWSAFFSVAFLVTFLLDGETSRTWTLGMIVLPVGMGLALVALVTVWDTTLRSRGFGSAAVAATATLVVGATVVALVSEWSKAYSLGTASTWWYVVVAAACALLSTTWRRWLDARPVPVPEGIADVDEWSRELAAILRGRYTMADARVRTIIGDAHAHAADAGRSVQEEFGTPEEYAARFTPDLARQSRLLVAFYLTVVALNLVGVALGFSWRSLVVAAGFAWLAWQEHQRYRRLWGDSG